MSCFTFRYEAVSYNKMYVNWTLRFFEEHYKEGSFFITSTGTGLDIQCNSSSYNIMKEICVIHCSISVK